MLLYLVRHGETDWNVQRRIQGASDTPLNEVGYHQARALVPVLTGRLITAVYSSPLQRAMQTARLAAEALGLEVQPAPGLAEMDQGELEGMEFAEIQRRYDGFLDKWHKRPAEVRMPGGETMAELQERAWAEIEAMRRAHPLDTVAAFSHNLTIITVLCRILGVHLNDFRRIRQHNAALNIIEHSEARGWSVVTMNALFHLQDTPGAERNPYL